MNLLTLEKNRLFNYLENIKSDNLGFSFSFLLHTIILFVAIGLPNFFNPQPINIPKIIPIEIINFTENTTIIPKKNNETNLLEEKQKNVEEKKFNSSDTQEILSVDEKKFNSSDTQEIQKVDIKENPSIKMETVKIQETQKQNIIIKKKKEVPINIEKEKIKIKIKTNQVISLPTKKIKPKLKPQPAPEIEKPEKQLGVEVKEKLKIEKMEKQKKIEVRAKLKPKPKPERQFSIASMLKDLRNEESIIATEKKIENKEEVITDVKSNINNEAESQARISIGNAIVQQIQQCWSVNSGGLKEDSEIGQFIIAEARYKKNGVVIGNSVQIIDTNIPDSSILISGVKYALYNCRLNLPDEYYHLWKKNRIRFDHDLMRQKNLEQRNMNLFN